jgi:hypothetical protein
MSHYGAWRAHLLMEVKHKSISTPRAFAKRLEEGLEGEVHWKIAAKKRKELLDAGIPEDELIEQSDLTDEQRTIIAAEIIDLADHTHWRDVPPPSNLVATYNDCRDHEQGMKRQPYAEKPGDAKTIATWGVGQP